MPDSGYHVVTPDTIPERAGLPGSHYYLEDAIELESLSMQVVAAAPGEEFAPYHSHTEQEEVFYVLDGQLHVETPAKEYVVDAGDWFLVQPGNPLHPYNPATATGTVRALLVNAPPRDDFVLYDEK